MYDEDRRSIDILIQLISFEYGIPSLIDYCEQLGYPSNFVSDSYNDVVDENGHIRYDDMYEYGVNYYNDEQSDEEQITALKTKQINLLKELGVNDKDALQLVEKYTTESIRKCGYLEDHDSVTAEIASNVLSKVFNSLRASVEKISVLETALIGHLQTAITHHRACFVSLLSALFPQLSKLKNESSNQYTWFQYSVSCVISATPERKDEALCIIKQFAKNINEQHPITKETVLHMLLRKLHRHAVHLVVVCTCIRVIVHRVLLSRRVLNLLA